MEERIFYITVFLSSLLGVIIAFFITSIIRYHRRYVRMQRERITAEVRLLENERKRIAGDLHDSLGPLLSSVKLKISSVEVPDAEDRKVIQQSAKHIDEIITSMRQISYDLLPIALERKGLIEAVRDFVTHLGREDQLEVSVYTMNTVTPHPEQDIHLYRILQEIIHNTLKHANASRLDIGFRQEANELLLLVQDNGQGFSVEKAREHSRGLGLKSLETRTDILKGTIHIRSAVGEGTRYYIRIPRT
ncbi:sensor histidine kinase [Chitinophaga rhizosphaerae]|uniref:sensor histidine kinase n=1 Tax=Chitinophaga rhizosphaerae TaxID=1864947 RepID=UPI000F80BEF4|nr:sensor histidine kinase [Chitinophaga rhizosphaerae]